MCLAFPLALDSSSELKDVNSICSLYDSHRKIGKKKQLWVSTKFNFAAKEESVGLKGEKTKLYRKSRRLNNCYGFIEQNEPKILKYKTTIHRT